MTKCCVVSEVRTQFLNINYTASYLKLYQHLHYFSQEVTFKPDRFCRFVTNGLVYSKGF